MEQVGAAPNCREREDASVRTHHEERGRSIRAEGMHARRRISDVEGNEGMHTDVRISSGAEEQAHRGRDAYQRSHAPVTEVDEGSRSPGCILIKPLTSG
jgi:hypothetical protein